MSLTRGSSSNFPCTRCLIPAGEQGDPSGHGDARTSASMQAVIQDARQQDLVKDREALLKSFGLRDIDVRFIFLFVSCPHLSSS